MAHVEVLPQLAAGLKAQHGVVVQAVVSEQDDATGLQHLKDAHVLDHGGVNKLDTRQCAYK